MAVKARTQQVRRVAKVSVATSSNFTHGLLLADTALVDCDVAEARAGALELVDEALARSDVFVGIVSTDSSDGVGHEDFVSNAELGAVLGVDRLRKILDRGSMRRGFTAHANAILDASETGVNAKNIVLIEGSSEGLVKAVALQMSIRVVLTPSLCSVEDLDRQEAVYCQMGAEAVCPSLETETYKVTLSDLLPKEGSNEDLEPRLLPGSLGNECVVDWVAMSNVHPRQFS